MRYLLLSLIWLIAHALQAQQLLVDRGVRAAELWCFPVQGDTLSYYYLPARGRLAADASGTPEFSFLRYVTEAPTTDGTSSVTAAGGGAIVNFLVLYDTPAEQVERAETALREKLKADDIVLKGPWAFTSGRYVLVSSILGANGENEPHVLATGTAPTLENSRVALSFALSPERAQLLMESFRMNTPDISVVFELDFEGLTDGYEAKVEVDFDEVRKSRSYSAGGSVYFVGAEVEVALDEMRRDNAIKLTQVGENANMEALLTTVYDKLLGFLFQKVEPEKIEKSRGGLLDALGGLLGGGKKAHKNPTGFGLSVGYKHKDLKASGKTVLTFSGKSTVARKHFVTFNVGNLWRQYGERTDLFRDVPLYDPAFQQREIAVAVDGSLERAFADMVNSVTVRLRKNHDGGSTTLREVLLDRNNFNDTTASRRMVYLNDGDSLLTDWLRYEYQTVWQFSGGGSYVTPWDTTDAAMINLYTPFERREIELQGDMAALESLGYRAASVKISYPFFDQRRTDSRLLRPSRGTTEPFRVTLPRGSEAINYQISLMKSDGSVARWRGTDVFGLIFYDEPPSND